LQIDAVRSAIAIIDEMLSGVPSVNTTRERVTERDRVIETETRGGGERELIRNGNCIPKRGAGKEDCWRRGGRRQKTSLRVTIGTVREFVLDFSDHYKQSVQHIEKYGKDHPCRCYRRPRTRAETSLDTRLCFSPRLSHSSRGLLEIRCQSAEFADPLHQEFILPPLRSSADDRTGLN